MKYLIFSLTLSLGTLANAMDYSACEALLKSDSTAGIIAYLSALLEENQIGEEQLQVIRDGIIQNGEIVNPIVPKAMAERIHSNAIQEYISAGGLDAQKILAWTTDSLGQNQQHAVERTEAKQQTSDVAVKLVWNLVKPGKFEMGESHNHVPVTLTNPFLMMATPVTQKMWVDVMGENPSHFSKGGVKVWSVRQDIKAKPNGLVKAAAGWLKRTFESKPIETGHDVEMQPDNPVENVTWWAAAVFANEMSKREGLQPAYDLSEFHFTGSTHAADGTLDIYDAKLSRVRINAPGGDIYQAEGYRLPTEAEWEFVSTNRGQPGPDYFPWVTEENLGDYAWTNENSGDQTHPVATNLPFTVDGKDFYDLLGHVWEWVYDWKGNNGDHSIDNLAGGADPAGPPYGFNRIMRGGSITGPKDPFYARHRGAEWPGHRSRSIGFRLVRTVK